MILSMYRLCCCREQYDFHRYIIA